MNEFRAEDVRFDISFATTTELALECANFGDRGMRYIKDAVLQMFHRARRANATGMVLKSAKIGDRGASCIARKL